MNRLWRYLLVCALFVAVTAGSSLAAHMYYIGVLSSFSNNQMIVDGNVYYLSPTVKVILRVVGSNGAMHEQKGRLSDVSVGNKLTIKVVNGQITEIEKIVSR
jgi:hypothetical protein